MRFVLNLSRRLSLADRVQLFSLVVKGTVVDTLADVDPALRREILRNAAESFLAEDDARRQVETKVDPKLTLTTTHRSLLRNRHAVPGKWRR